MSKLSFEKALNLSVRAATVLQPRTPIQTKDLFAGRWTELTTVADAVNQIGLHALIYGERGVGKTSLSNIIGPTIWALDGSNLQDQTSTIRLIVRTVTASGDSFANIWEKLFKEVMWRDNKPTVGFLQPQRPAESLLQAFGLDRAALNVDTVRRVLNALPGSVFIVDEFDRAARETSRDFTDLIKALSDLGINTTIVIVGVAETVEKLIEDHASIGRQLMQVHVPRMQPDDLRVILRYAEQSLPVSFSQDASDLIVAVSQGLPHFTHLIGLEAIRAAARQRYTDEVERVDVFNALKNAVKLTEQSVASKYAKATHSAQKDALYKKILLACAVVAARASDSMGWFSPASVSAPLSAILDKAVKIATFNSHLSDFMDVKRGEILERSGHARSYRFRFRDPMVVPYVFMTSIASGIVTDFQLMKLLVE